MDGWERVYAVHDFHDGPLRGVADCGGAPHAFERRWNSSADDWDAFFRLQPIAAETLAAVVEAWGIWQRWRTAFDRGEAVLQSHPALPQERARREELSRFLAGRLDLPNEASRWKGEFRGNLLVGPAEVRWSR